MAKQNARLEDWQRTEGRLIGRVYDHPAFDDGDRVRTSLIVSPPDSIKEGGTAETKNTFYKLGKEGK